MYGHVKNKIYDFLLLNTKSDISEFYDVNVN